MMALPCPRRVETQAASAEAAEASADSRGRPGLRRVCIQALRPSGGTNQRFDLNTAPVMRLALQAFAMVRAVRPLCVGSSALLNSAASAMLNSFIAGNYTPRR